MISLISRHTRFHPNHKINYNNTPSPSSSLYPPDPNFKRYNLFEEQTYGALQALIYIATLTLTLGLTLTLTAGPRGTFHLQFHQCTRELRRNRGTILSEKWSINRGTRDLF